MAPARPDNVPPNAAKRTSTKPHYLLGFDACPPNSTYHSGEITIFALKSPFWRPWSMILMCLHTPEAPEQIMERIMFSWVSSMPQFTDAERGTVVGTRGQLREDNNYLLKIYKSFL